MTGEGTQTVSSCFPILCILSGTSEGNPEWRTWDDDGTISDHHFDLTPLFYGDGPIASVLAYDSLLGTHKWKF